MKKIYILLMRSDTIYSKLIHKVTGDEYTHASISLNDCQSFYSFARKESSQKPWKAGFVEEKLNEGIVGENQSAPCALYSLEISQEQFLHLEQRVIQMRENSHMFKYSMNGLIFCYFQINYRRQHHYFCSQFVAELLDSVQCLTLKKEPTTVLPNDFVYEPNLQPQYFGTIKNLQNEYLKPFCKKEKLCQLK